MEKIVALTEKNGETDDDPEVSFVCSTPTSANDTSNAAASLCTTEILPQVLEEFFKIYK